MIRPLTCFAFLSACLSALFLYQEKHRVQVIDRRIEETVHHTRLLTEQTRLLRAEWMLLNEPGRLQRLSGEFLRLQTVSPGQYTDLAHLDSRLPPPDKPVPDAPPSQRISANPPLPSAVPEPEAAAAVRTAAEAAVGHWRQAAGDTRSPDSLRGPRDLGERPHILAPHARGHEENVAGRRTERHVHEARTEPPLSEPPRPEQLRLQPLTAVPARFPRTQMPPQPYSGSMLGMAQGAHSVAAPVPMPLSPGR